MFYYLQFYVPNCSVLAPSLVWSVRDETKPQDPAVTVVTLRRCPQIAATGLQSDVFSHLQEHWVLMLEFHPFCHLYVQHFIISPVSQKPVTLVMGMKTDLSLG